MNFQIDHFGVKFMYLQIILTLYSFVNSFCYPKTFKLIFFDGIKLTYISDRHIVKNCRFEDNVFSENLIHNNKYTFI